MELLRPHLLFLEKKGYEVVTVTKQQLLLQPDTIIEEPDEEDEEEEPSQQEEDDLFGPITPIQNEETMDFPDDFYH